jgi:alpha-beta hydrolase superfamily lysophospholipase
MGGLIATALVLRKQYNLKFDAVVLSGKNQLLNDNYYFIAFLKSTLAQVPQLKPIQKLQHHFCAPFPALLLRIYRNCRSCRR